MYFIMQNSRSLKEAFDSRQVLNGKTRTSEGNQLKKAASTTTALDPLAFLSAVNH